MPLLNYTTSIAADKTVGEIQSILAKAGASRILVEYVAAMPSGLAFEIRGTQYRLPCRVEAVWAILRNDYSVPRRLRTEAQARRVAWRILRAWVEAQLAIIQTGMVAVDEVFLPYQLTGGGETVYQLYQRTDRLLVDTQTQED